MVKLYNFTPGRICYHEAWLHDDVVVEHWGELGKRGETREHPADPTLDEAANLERVLGESRPYGFKAISDDDHRSVVIEYPLDSWGSPNDLERRHAIEDRVNELLGWTGLGRCDGGSIGSGTMEVSCVVVDAEIAIDVLRRNLTGAITGGHTRIYEIAEDTD